MKASQVKTLTRVLAKLEVVLYDLREDGYELHLEAGCFEEAEYQRMQARIDMDYKLVDQAIKHLRAAKV